MSVQVTYARRPLARKNTPVRLAALGPEEFEGYASLFGVVDGAGDTVAPGAFAASDVTLSEAVALLATDLGIARENAGQLSHLEKAVDTEK